MNFFVPLWVPHQCIRPRVHWPWVIPSRPATPTVSGCQTADAATQKQPPITSTWKALIYFPWQQPTVHAFLFWSINNWLTSSWISEKEMLSVDQNRSIEVIIIQMWQCNIISWPNFSCQSPVSDTICPTVDLFKWMLMVALFLLHISTVICFNFLPWKSAYELSVCGGGRWAVEWRVMRRQLHAVSSDRGVASSCLRLFLFFSK